MISLLSSGFSGFSQNHSDIGGYITMIPNVALKVPFVDYRRSPELLRRWIELNAFTAVFRTHEGNQPERNHQVADDLITLALFAKPRVYALLGSYRAASRGGNGPFATCGWCFQKIPPRWTCTGSSCWGTRSWSPRY